MKPKDKKVNDAPDAPVLYQTLIVKNARIESSSIETWQNAVNSAKRGERTKLYDLYDNVLADTILANAVDKRINAITNAELAFIRDGQNVEQIDDLIDSVEFEELIKEIILSKAYGKSVIEIMFNPRFNIFSYPRRNIRITNLDRPLAEHRKFIASKETDREGYDFTTDPRFIECGKDDELGFLFKAAQYVIYKRGGFGDWAQFVEIFGMPFLLGKYNSYDEKARDQLFKALEELGSNPKGAIPEGTNIEIHENKSSGSSSLYRDFRAACNEEILIAVLGNTMTTVQGDKGARSLGEVHQDTEQKINAADRRFVARTLNRYLLPMLIERGYHAEGGYFVFPDAGENMTTNDRVDLALKIRREGIPVDDDYIYNISGIPKPDVGAGSARPPKEPTKPPPSEKPESNSKNRITSNSVEKIEKTPTPPPVSPWQRLKRFFVQAPAAMTGATGNSTTKSTANTINNSVLPVHIDIKDLFLQAIKNIYANAGGRQALVERLLFDITNTVLQAGINQQFELADDVEFGQKNSDFIDQFRYNTAVFSAFKNHQQTAEIVSLLYDDDGNLRSFHQFKKLAGEISKDYNERWLQTEYNTAVRAARLAVNYKKYLETKHLYPNLEYILSSAPDKSRRKIHESWVGTVLPIEHTWWDDHIPPSDWNCKCSVRQTDKPETAIPQTEDTHNPVFRNHPGKTASFIKLNEHPYVTCPHVGTCSRQSLSLSIPSIPTLSTFPPPTTTLSDPPNRQECQICMLAKTWQANQTRIASNLREYNRLKNDPNYVNVKFNPQTGGLKATHRLHNFDRQVGIFGIKRGLYESKARDVLYNYGMKVILESEVAPEGVSVADGFLNDIKFDIKGVEKMGEYTIKNKFIKARRQEANTIVLYYHNESVFSMELLEAGYIDYIMQTRRDNQVNCINTIYYIIENKLYRF